MLKLNDWDGEQTDVVINAPFEDVIAKMKVRPALTFTSPPYSVGKIVTATATTKVDRGHDPYDYHGYDEHNDHDYDEAKYVEWIRSLIAKSDIVFWNVPAKQFDRTFGVTEFLNAAVGQVIWSKPNAVPFPKRGVIYFHELIWIFGDRSKIYKPFKSVWTQAPDRWNKHPAPFPPELPAKAIQYASQKGDLIFDPFGGSGTTAAVAKALGRKYITCDISAQYCEWIDSRLAKTKTV